MRKDRTSSVGKQGDRGAAGARSSRRRVVAGLGGAAVGLVLPAILPSGAIAAQRCVKLNQAVRRCQAGIYSNVISISARPQYRTQWCWAACIAMMFHYFKHPVQQDRIVRETFGSIVNWPATPKTILSALNRTWRDDNGKPFTARGLALAVNPVIASRLLSRDIPMIVGSVGHATLLTAMEWTENAAGRYVINGIVVRDPWYGGRARRYSGREAQLAHFLATVRVRSL